MSAVIKEAFEKAEKVEADKPLPLRKPATKAESFPANYMGELLAGAALAIQDKVQAPLAICAQSVLAAATLAVQAHANVVLPIGQTKPLSNFFLTISESGERKSGCDNIALQAINEHEERLFEKYKEEIKCHQIEHDAWNACRKEILAKKKQSKSDKQKEIDALGAEPIKPISPLLTCSEPTFEGLVLQLVWGIPSIGVFSDEGGQFISGHAMNQDNKVKSISAFSKLWDGAPIKRVRAGDGTTALFGRRVCIHLMAQHEVANIMLSDSMLQSQGYLSRFLVCEPESTVGTRFSKESKAESEIALQSYNARISEILQVPLPIKPDSMNQLEPRELHFSAEAKQIWTRFSDHIEHLLVKGGEMEPIKGLANKLAEHAARLAAVLTLFEDIYASEIDLRSMEGGIALAQFYASEALRLFDQGKTDPNIVKAERLFDWLTNKWGEDKISAVEIYQTGVAGLTSRAAAMAIIKILEEHNYLLLLDGKHLVNGEMRKQVWQIVRV